MLKKNVIAGAIASAFLSAAASVGAYAQAGGAAVPFILISPDSRANGMGDAGTGIADNINAIHWNSAGLIFQAYSQPGKDPKYQQGALSYSKWLPQFQADLFYSYAAFGRYFEEVQGVLAANFIFMNLGEFQRTNEQGQALGTFRSNEFALSFAYSTLLTDDLSGGVVFKYIQSNLAGTSTSGGSEGGTGRSGAFDLALMYKPLEFKPFGLDLDNRFGLGLNIQNIGPSMTYNTQADPLPSMLRLGVGIDLVRDEYNELRFGMDFAKLLVRRTSEGTDRIPRSLVTAWQNPGGEFSMGMEYIYEKVIALRAGYFAEPETAGNRKYLTFGAGVKYDIFGFDFSFINPMEENHPLANTLRFTLLVDWNQVGG